jgi:hypothetical protein
MQFYVSFTLRMYESKQALCSPNLVMFVRIVLIGYSINVYSDNFNLLADYTI